MALIRTRRNRTFRRPDLREKADIVIAPEYASP
jgi:hypothetical protein